MERYKDLGVNYIQYEIGVNNVMKRGCPAQSWELDDVNTAGTPNGHKYTMLYSGGALQLDSSGSGEVYVSQTVAVKPSTTYTFGIDFKCQSASSIWIKADGARRQKSGFMTATMIRLYQIGNQFLILLLQELNRHN